MNLDAVVASLENRLREIEALVGKPIVRQNLAQVRRAIYVGRIKSGSTFARNGTAPVIRHKVGASGGTSAVSPTKEETVVDPGAIVGGPLASNTLVYYALIDGVLSYIGHDCNA